VKKAIAESGEDNAIKSDADATEDADDNGGEADEE